MQICKPMDAFLKHRYLNRVEKLEKTCIYPFSFLEILKWQPSSTPFNSDVRQHVCTALLKVQVFL